MRALIPGIVVLVGAITATVPPAATPEYEEAKVIAQQVLDGTRAMLQREMSEKGPAGAMGACAAVALGEATRHERQGWRVRRVSLQVRNPADAPDRYEAKVLREFERMKRRGLLRPGTEHVAVVPDQGRPTLRYLRPITIASPLCLTCHGPARDLDAGVRQALREHYPKDRATGYRAGDLRGAISIAIPLERQQEKATP